MDTLTKKISHLTKNVSHGHKDIYRNILYLIVALQLRTKRKSKEIFFIHSADFYSYKTSIFFQLICYWFETDVPVDNRLTYKTKKSDNHYRVATLKNAIKTKPKY